MFDWRWDGFPFFHYPVYISAMKFIMSIFKAKNIVLVWRVLVYNTFSVTVSFNRVDYVVTLVCGTPGILKVFFL